MKFKRKRKSKRQKIKDKCWQWMAKYIKLRDAIGDSLDRDFRYVKCRTCGRILERGTRDCQGGHWLSRGLGGSSGIYFNEKAVYTQCSQCNKYRQGAPEEMEGYIRETYGDDTIDELKILHKINSYSESDIIGLTEYYKNEYNNMLKKYNLRI